MKYFLFLLTILSTTANAGSLQDADFATSAAITGAGGAVSQLLNSSKMYNTVDSEIMNTSIARWDAKLSSPVNLATQVTGVLGYVNGGTGFSSYTNGQLLIGDSGTGGLDKATLTAGSGISIVNSPGGITISATAVANTFAQEIPAGAVNNSNVTFTLAHTPVSNAALIVSLDGLILNQGVDYTISTATITFTVAPNFNQKPYASYQF
jgi:hypothetical protein